MAVPFMYVLNFNIDLELLPWGGVPALSVECIMIKIRRRKSESIKNSREKKKKKKKRNERARDKNIKRKKMELGR